MSKSPIRSVTVKSPALGVVEWIVFSLVVLASASRTNAETPFEELKRGFPDFARLLTLAAPKSGLSKVQLDKAFDNIEKWALESKSQQVRDSIDLLVDKERMDYLDAMKRASRGVTFDGDGSDWPEWSCVWRNPEGKEGLRPEDLVAAYALWDGYDLAVRMVPSAPETASREKVSYWVDFDCLGDEKWDLQLGVHVTTRAKASDNPEEAVTGAEPATQGAWSLNVAPSAQISETLPKSGTARLGFRHGIEFLVPGLVRKQFTKNDVRFQFFTFRSQPRTFFDVSPFVCVPLRLNLEATSKLLQYAAVTLLPHDMPLPEPIMEAARRSERCQLASGKQAHIREFLTSVRPTTSPSPHPPDTPAVQAARKELLARIDILHNAAKAQGETESQSGYEALKRYLVESTDPRVFEIVDVATGGDRLEFLLKSKVAIDALRIDGSANDWPPWAAYAESPADTFPQNPLGRVSVLCDGTRLAVRVDTRPGVALPMTGWSLWVNVDVDREPGVDWQLLLQPQISARQRVHQPGSKEWQWVQSNPLESALGACAESRTVLLPTAERRLTMGRVGAFMQLSGKAIPGTCFAVFPAKPPLAGLTRLMDLGAAGLLRPNDPIPAAIAATSALPWETGDASVRALVAKQDVEMVQLGKEICDWQIERVVPSLEQMPTESLLCWAWRGGITGLWGPFRLGHGRESLDQVAYEWDFVNAEVLRSLRNMGDEDGAFYGSAAEVANGVRSWAYGHMVPRLPESMVEKKRKSLGDKDPSVAAWLAALERDKNDGSFWVTRPDGARVENISLYSASFFLELLRTRGKFRGQCGDSVTMQDALARAAGLPMVCLWIKPIKGPDPHIRGLYFDAIGQHWVTPEPPAPADMQVEAWVCRPGFDGAFLASDVTTRAATLDWNGSPAKILYGTSQQMLDLFWPHFGVGQMREIVLEGVRMGIAKPETDGKPPESE